MQKIENFKLKDVPVENIIFIITSTEDNEMSRLIVVEEWPKTLTDYTIIEGYHCSCNDFDECQWEAITYSRDELQKLAHKWSKQWAPDEECMIGKLLINYFNSN